ncbi:MAG: PAS domain S-box protein [Candidatus Promineifilaceae bacterium]
MGSSDSNIPENQSSRDRKTDLLQALTAASGSLQRSARSREAVFKAFEEQIAALGWYGTILFLDESGEKFTIEALAYPPSFFGPLEEGGKQFNREVIGFTIPVKYTILFHKIVNNKKPYFTPSRAEIIPHLLQDYDPSFQGYLVDLMGSLPLILAPMIAGKVVYGLVAISSPTLTEDEIPAVETFTNQIAIAFENADLISALQASETRQRLLFDQASDGIFVYDEDARLIDINRSGCWMLGYTREELLGKHYRELIAPENLVEKPLLMDKLLEEKALIIERVMQRKDGTRLTVEVSARLLPVSGMQAVVRDISARIQSERALHRREKILEAIAFAARQFLRLPTWENGIDEVLSLLGKAANVSRVYIFQNHTGEKGSILTSQLFEWVAPDIPSQMNNPELQGLDYEASGFGRWMKKLSAGQNIFGLVETFPGPEQAVLVPQETNSILVVPIFSRQDWWGFIGFDECSHRREWEPSEIDALQAAAGTIGAAIERQKINIQERQRRQEAEKLMAVTTALTSTLNLDQVLNNILVHLQQVVPFISACVFLIQENMIRAVVAHNLPDKDAVIGHLFPIDDDVFVAQMRHTHQPVILKDAQKDPTFKSWGETSYIRGWMGVPLLVREKVIGYVTLDSDKVGTYQENETRLAQAFVNQAAIAIENAQLFAETQRLLRQTREQTQQLQQIMDIVPDGILLLDNQKRVISVNQAGEAYLHLLGELLEDGRLVRIGPYTLEELYQPVPTPPPWQEFGSKDGQLLFEAALWPLDRTHESDYMVLAIQDVTEERAKQSYRSAQERLAIVGQMAAGIAHDFNNIMAIIMLYAQLLLQIPNLSTNEEKKLVTILQQSERASELIHQILDFSRQSLLERRSLNLQPFLRELTHLLQRTLPENIDVLLEQQNGQLMINGDPTRIQQIIMNLALNARDAMPDGGTLKLMLNDLVLNNDQETPLPDMSPGKWLQLDVTDTGVGISAENLSHIFEPFFTTKSVGQGTGLGLAQVYGIVKQHEGFIDVQSTPPQGTTFTIYFPAFEPEKTLLPEDSPELPRTGKRETILVVEDNDNARDAVVEILEMLNYQTLAASNGSAALTLFKDNQSKIDLVLSDMVMPVMDGPALHRALLEIQPEIKMVMMTGYPLEQSGKTLLKENVVAWMQKPLHTDQIAQTVYQALNGPNV